MEPARAGLHGLVSTPRKAELPAKRFGEPSEVGKLYAYLCSTHAGYISGQSIPIDGAAHPQLM